MLDMGTGTGIQALAAAEKAARVLGVDINPEAVELARRNARLNNIGNVEFRVSNLFENVSEEFDLIVFNPPYLPTEDEDPSWDGGVDGIDVVNRFLQQAGAHLKPEGRIMLLVSSINNLDNVREIMDKAGLRSRVVASQKIFFEELYVLRACFY